MNIFRKGQMSDQDIYRWLLDLRAHAHIPQSHFAVAVVFRARCGGEEDYYFGGTNVENMDHHLSTHGEEGAICSLVTALGKSAEIVEGWVIGAPDHIKPGDGSVAAGSIASCCGRCRQQIAGFSAAGTKIHYFSLSGRMETTTVGEFLPQPFTFRQFIPDLVAIEKTGTAPPAADIEKRLIRKAPLSAAEISDWLKGLESIDYVSKTSQSIVVELDNGFYAAGIKIEEASFSGAVNVARCAMAVATSAFGTQKVLNVWVYTCGRDEKKLPVGSFGTLPMSALQVLFEFAKDETLPVHYLGEDGLVVNKTLITAAEIAPVSHRAFQKA